MAHLTVARWVHLEFKGETKVVKRTRYVKGDDLSAVPEEEVARLIEIGAAAEGDAPVTSEKPLDPSVQGLVTPSPSGTPPPDGLGAEGQTKPEPVVFNPDTADYDEIKAYAVEHDIHAIIDGVESFKKKDLVAAIKQHQSA